MCIPSCGNIINSCVSMCAYPLSYLPILDIPAPPRKVRLMNIHILMHVGPEFRLGVLTIGTVYCRDTVATSACRTPQEVVHQLT